MLRTLNQGLKDIHNHTQELKLTLKEQQKWITSEISRLNQRAYEGRDLFLARRRGIYLKDRSEWLDTVKWVLSLLLPLLCLNILPLAWPIITFKSLPGAQALPDVVKYPESRLLIRLTDIDRIFVKELPLGLDIDYETIVWEIHRDPRLNHKKEVYKTRVDLKRMYYRRIR